MRLINSETFDLISWRAHGKREYMQGFDDGVKYVAEMIDAAPVIDAIPVEWLEAQIRPYYGDARDIGMTTRNGTIKILVRKWHEEQEAKA